MDTWRLAQHSDIDELREFMLDNEHKVDNCISKFDGGISGFIHYSFEKGEILLSEDSTHHKVGINAIAIYSVGTLAKNFEDKELGYVLMFILHETSSYKVFVHGLSFMFKRMHEKSIQDIECKVIESDDKTINLYKKISIESGKDVSLVGTPSIIFTSSLEHSKKSIERYL